MCSLGVHLADTRPHSPATLAYESITHTGYIGSTRAIYGEADHAPTCAYRLLSLPNCQLSPHNVTLSHRFFSRSESPFTIATAVPTSTRICRWYCCINIWPSFFFQTPPAVHYYSSTTGDRSDSQRNSDPDPSHTHQHHCERCYDYDLFRCRSEEPLQLYSHI